MNSAYRVLELIQACRATMIHFAWAAIGRPSQIQLLWQKDCCAYVLRRL